MTDNRHKGAALPSVPQTAPEVEYNAFSGTSIHGKTREAFEAMAYEGIDLHSAAQRVGMRPDNLARAFKKKNVRRAYNQLIKAIRENAAQGAYMRINHISKTSASDHVKLDANRWIAGVDGISPVQKVEGRHLHRHDFGGFDYGDAEARDVTPEDAASHADD